MVRVKRESRAWKSPANLWQASSHAAERVGVETPSKGHQVHGGLEPETALDARSVPTVLAEEHGLEGSPTQRELTSPVVIPMTCPPTRRSVETNGEEPQCAE
jgi:hypothetical protein